MAAGLAGAGPVRGAFAALASRHWDRQIAETCRRDMDRRAWTGIPQIHWNHNYLTTGNRQHSWIEYLRDRYFEDGFAGDTLSLGCGEGHVDRVLKDCGFKFKSFTGVDVSPKSVDAATRLAQEKELCPSTRYMVADLNQYEPPAASFDFIYFFQSLHHLKALEHVLDACAKALRPGGLLMVNEFVGPSRFQWTDTQLQMATELIGLIPEPLRRDVRRSDGRPKKSAARPWALQMMVLDPSEAVRSAEIEMVLKQRFDVVEEKNWGGTLNFLVFENIAANFDANNPYHNAVVDLLIHHENTLIGRGVLPSDFKLFMARPKAADHG